MYCVAGESQYAAVSAASAKFTNAMVPGRYYRFCCNTNCWVHVGLTGGAAQADTANNHYVHAGQEMFLRNPDLSSSTSAFVHVIQDSAAGDATLSLVE